MNFLKKYINLAKLFVRRLDYFIEKYDYLNGHQDVFRSNRSTSLAVVEFVGNIATVVDNEQLGVGVFFFICVKHLTR